MLKILEWVAQRSSATINFSEIQRGPNNETVSNESSTNFYLPDMIDPTAVDERILEVAVVSGNAY